MLGITLYPFGGNFGKGFKSLNYTLCKEYNGEQFIHCIEEETYSLNDVNMTTTTTANNYMISNNVVRVKSFFVDLHWHGIAQSMELKTGVITEEIPRSLQLILNNSLSYKIRVMDPKLQIPLSDNPDSMPRIIFRKQKNTTALFVYLKVLQIMFSVVNINIYIDILGHKT